MSEKFCDSCGAALVEGAKFCKNCGKDVSAADSATTPPPQQGYYQAPPQQQVYYQAAPQQDTTPMTVGQYLITFLITCIPLVGLIMLFVWAFGSDTNINKRNYARAMLIVAAILVVLNIIFVSFISSFIGSFFNSLGGDYFYY